MIHCRSAHRQCRSAVTPEYSAAGAHIHNAKVSSTAGPHLLSTGALGLQIVPLSERTYTVLERCDSKTVLERCDSRVLHCRSPSSTVGDHIHSAGVLSLKIPLPECTYTVSEHCDSRFHCERMIHCQSAHRQCRSTVASECCTAGAHLHSARAHHLLPERKYIGSECCDSRFHCRGSLT
ncbi:hypothetical protein AMTR_s00019p00085500 [Amborella trichopoda]|uniref:Uncharacterized protein n=1 Tax=Amborella trichopoda TaxID=13333 RepID=W1PJ06_AMBTC|nr:hypothetical protein AMTR_s00019p00085500 [Amborella trichopoda]